MFIHIKFFIIYIFLFLVETVIKSFHDVSIKRVFRLLMTADENCSMSRIGTLPHLPN